MRFENKRTNIDELRNFVYLFGFDHIKTATTEPRALRPHSRHQSNRQRCKSSTVHTFGFIVLRLLIRRWQGAIGLVTALFKGSRECQENRAQKELDADGEISSCAVHLYIGLATDVEMLMAALAANYDTIYHLNSESQDALQSNPKNETR